MKFLAVFALLLGMFAKAASGGPADAVPVCGVVEGLVFAAGDGAPVAWAWVKLVRMGGGSSLRDIQAISGGDGSFVIGALYPGQYNVYISHIAYTAENPAVVVVLPGETSRLEVKLHRRLHRQPAIVVQASRKTEKTTSLENLIDGDMLPRLGGIVNDPVRALATRPGAETRNDFDARISVRGAGPLETGYVLDGMPLPFAYHLGGIASIFHPDAVDYIRFYTGGFPASLGPGSAGVISVVTKDALPDELALRRVELSPIALSTLWSGDLNSRVGAFASLRGTYHNLILDAVGAETGVAVPNFHDAFLTLGWKLEKNQKLSLRLLRSGDSMRMGMGGFSQGGSDNEVHVTGNLLRASVSWDGRHTAADIEAGGRVGVAYQPFEYDLRVTGSDTESMDWDAEAGIITLGAFVKRGQHLVETGAVQVSQTLNYNVNMARGFLSAWSGTQGEGSMAADPVTLKQTGSMEAGTRSLFVQDRWSPGPNWSVTAGLRMADFFASGERKIDPRLTAEWHDDLSAIYACWGVYHGHPVEQVGDPSVLGDRIRARRSVHKVLGIRQSLGGWGEVKAEMYERYTTGQVSEVSPGEFESVGEGWSAGTEIQWRRVRPRWEFEGAYSFTRSMSWDPEGPLVKSIGTTPAGAPTAGLAHAEKAWYRSPYDPGHGLTLRAASQAIHNFYFGLSWHYRSGAATTPVDKIVYDDYGTAFGQEGEVGSARLPAYHRLDLRIEHPFYNSWGKWKAYLEVMNLYNRPNVFQASYDKTYSRRNDYRMLPVVPVIGISLEF